jgi:hypothetical protein
MQTNQLLVVSGIHKLVFERSELLPIRNQGATMSKTVSLRLSPSPSLFGRLFASLDRMLLTYAEMTIRNGDVQRCNV